jgi:hypothetical protein
LPISFSDVDTAIDAGNVYICCDRHSANQRVFMLFEDAGEIFLTSTANEGASFASAQLIGDGEKACMEIPATGARYIYRLDGTSILATVQDAQGNAIATNETVVTGVAAGSAIDVTSYVVGVGELRIMLVYGASGALEYRTSDMSGIDFGSAVTVKASGVDESGIAVHRCDQENFAIYWLSSGTIRGQILGGNLSPVGSDFVAVADAAGDMDCADFVTGRGDWRVGLAYTDGAGAIRLVTAKDGKDFS